MSLSKIDKNHLNQLITIPNLQELQNDKIVKAIQRNSNNYSKLKVLFKQMENIKKEIEEIVKESIETENLEKINCNFKKFLVKTTFSTKNLIMNYFSLCYPLKNGTLIIYLLMNIFTIMTILSKRFKPHFHNKT